MLRYAVLILGVFACSTSVIFIKSSTCPKEWLTALRLLIAAVALTPVFLWEGRKTPQHMRRKTLALSLPGALLLVVHFITWVMGARMAYVANSTLVVNLTPVALPFVMWLTTAERITRGEIIGTLIALSGVIALVAHDAKIDPEQAVGIGICFASMILFCFYIAMSRKLGAGRSVWLYVVPLYWVAGIVGAIYAGSLHALRPDIVAMPTWNAREIGLLLCIGLIPTVVGHSIMNWCIKHMRSAIVSTFNVFQFAFAGLMGWQVFKEKPEPLFYPVCALIIAGVIVVIRSTPAKQTPAQATLVEES